MAQVSPSNRGDVLVIPTLTSSENAGITHQIKQRALKLCNKQVLDFVECSKVGTLSVIWRCRDLNKVMNGCLNQYTSQDTFDQVHAIALDKKLHGIPSKDGVPPLPRARK